MTDELTERRERVARALRDSLYPNLPDDTPLGDGWLRHADAAIAAYESLEPEWEQVGWHNIYSRSFLDLLLFDNALGPAWEPVYRRVVPPQEAEGKEWAVANLTIPADAQEAEGREQNVGITPGHSMSATVTAEDAARYMKAQGLSLNPHLAQEAEGTCPTCAGTRYEPRRGCRACRGYSASSTGWWCGYGCGRDHGGMTECTDPFHSSPNPEGA